MLEEDETFFKILTVLPFEDQVVPGLELVDEFEHCVFHVFEGDKIGVSVDNQFVLVLLPFEFSGSLGTK